MDTPTSTTSALSDASVSDVFAWIKKGITVYLENPVILIATTAIAAVLGVFSIGILAGPLFAGVYGIILRLLDGDESVAVGDVFAKLDQFVDTVLYSIAAMLCVYLGGAVLEIIPAIGGFLAFCYQIAAQSALAFGLLLIVDRKYQVKQALEESVQLFLQNPPVMIVLCLCASLLVASGIIAFGVGVFLTLPVYACTMAVVYRDVVCQSTKESVQVDAKVVNE